MTYTTLVIVGLLFLTACNSNSNQNSDETKDSVSEERNSMRNYLASCSYFMELIGTDKDGRPKKGIGTGFFLKRGTKTYLVSCYHIFTSVDTRTKERAEYLADSIIIPYGMTYGKSKKLTIDLAKIKKGCKPYYDYERTDIFVYDVTGLVDQNIINSVERYFQHVSYDTEPSAIFSTGFAGDAIGPTTIQFKWITPTLRGYKATYKNAQAWVSNSYLANPASKQGMSGSPVFFEINNNPDSIILGGIIGTHLPANNACVIMKADSLQIEINKAASPKSPLRPCQ